MSDETEVKQAANEASIDNVKNFLRAGGKFTWHEWNSMPPEDHAMCAEAAERLDCERAALLAVALRTPDGTAEVFSKVDGGDAFVKGSLIHAVARAAARAGA